jgi:uncharacterized protein
MTTSPPDAVTPGRFAWHELMTTDPAAAQKFYKDVVGWTTSKWQEAPVDAGMDYSMWMAGQSPIGGVLNITPDAAAMGAPPNWLAYVEVADADRTVEQTINLGGSVIVPPQSVPQVGRFAVLRDPQGAVFGIIANESAMPAETDPKPLEFSWHELTTVDSIAAADFYKQLFGWEKRDEFDMGAMGMYRMFGRDRFTYGGMMDRPADMQMPPYWLHYVSVADSADAAVERAKAAGATVMHGPMDVPGGDRIAILQDPQGAMFAVHSKPAASPAS